MDVQLLHAGGHHRGRVGGDLAGRQRDARAAGHHSGSPEASRPLALAPVEPVDHEAAEPGEEHKHQHQQDGVRNLQHAHMLTRHSRPGPAAATTAPVASSVMRRLLVKVTAGADAPERCAQAFTVAATAASSGAAVELWLTGESSWFALPGRAETFELPHSAPLAGSARRRARGGSVTLCTQCAARRGIEAAGRDPGVRIAGAASFVESALADDVQALVY